MSSTDYRGHGESDSSVEVDMPRDQDSATTVRPLPLVGSEDPLMVNDPAEIEEELVVNTINDVPSEDDSYVTTNGSMVESYLSHDVDLQQVCSVEIIEQPQQRGFRFRYKCEGPAHGGLQGVNSTKAKRTYPSIKIHGYVGPARVIVSLMTSDDPPQPHVHELVGKNCNNGQCTVELKGDDDMTASFPNLGIQHVTKKDLPRVLMSRITEEMKTLKMQMGQPLILSDAEKQQAANEANQRAKVIHLNEVHLCFTVLLMDNSGAFSNTLRSVLSLPIYDSKSPSANVLKICRLDRTSGRCTGGEEVFLLCEKVQKDDIAVRFSQIDANGDEQWKAYGDFSPADVHRQYAIVFKTPAYLRADIESPVEVKLQLERRSDGACSEPKSFSYTPLPTDLEEIGKKRKKRLPDFSGSFARMYPM